MLTVQDITREKARELRKSLGLTQRVFWGNVGVQQSVGARYEDDVSIPKPVKMLLVLRYSAGLLFDTETKEGLKKIQEIAKVQEKQNEATRNAKSAQIQLHKAAKFISSANECLTKL